jgi:hypothetical protein
VIASSPSHTHSPRARQGDASPAAHPPGCSRAVHPRRAHEPGPRHTLKRDVWWRPQGGSCTSRPRSLLAEVRWDWVKVACAGSFADRLRTDGDQLELRLIWVDVAARRDGSRDRVLQRCASSFGSKWRACSLPRASRYRARHSSPPPPGMLSTPGKGRAPTRRGVVLMPGADPAEKVGVAVEDAPTQAEALRTRAAAAPVAEGGNRRPGHGRGLNGDE